MQSLEQPRGFERAQELQKESFAEVADDYSSEAQARAAAQLVEVAAKHKKIDIELAGRAKAMLREMVDSGGDLDLDAVRGLVDEAERRYAWEDETTEHAVVPVDDHATTFFEIPRATEPVRAVEPLSTVHPGWERWRAHLVTAGIMDATGHIDQHADSLGLTKEQLEYLSALQQERYMTDPEYQGIVHPRYKEVG